MQRRSWCGLLVLAACSAEKEPAFGERVETTPPAPSTTTPPPISESPPNPAPAAPVWLAFSGGGYFGHTAHSGVTMAMLEATGLDLAGLTANVVGVAANSGGTWFATQLAYSEPFRDALESDPAGWTTTGYLGQSEALFSFDDPCLGYSGSQLEICEGAPALQPAFAMGKITGATTLDWHGVVSNGIYAPFGMSAALADATPDAPRQRWADGKSLVFAGTVLTDQAILAQEPGFLSRKDFYSASPTVAGVPPQHAFAPVAFGSAGADGVRPSFLLPGALEIEYTTNEFPSADSIFATLPADVSMDVSILDVAAASSAIAAAAASIGVLDETGITDGVPLTNDEIAYLVREVAPAFGVADGALSRLDPVPAYIEDQSALGALRLGDGAYTDNTAVAYAVRALGGADDFTILAFVAAGGDLSQRGAVLLPTDFQRLFSGGDVDAAGVTAVCMDDLCVNTMSPAVFDGAALDTATVRWSWAEDGVELTHVEIPVVTVDNPSFGVEAGHAGVVHVFVTFLLDAPLFPVDGASFATFADTLDGTHAGIVAGGGWEGLADVLGVR